MGMRVFGYSLPATLLGLGAFAGAVLALPALADWKADTIARLDAAEGELLSLNTRANRLAAQLQAVPEVEGKALKWHAGEIGVVTAQIQSEINQLATSSGIALRSIAPTGQGLVEDVQTVTFRLEAEATLDRLAQFLQSLEFGQPVLLVDAANIRRLNRPGAEGTQPIVFVQLGLSAPTELAGEVSQ
ncbi:Type II secretion system (T2SS), protein M subtype b [Aliiroseovarius halocynthiae]|nr:GspMb/PilO family protein [Aliiroseovarius halocynthiae]SMR83564.1 Type II secretion system (T2SS), protein M subtype b [Aliiroseovarius halocynthiae]